MSDSATNSASELSPNPPDDVIDVFTAMTQDQATTSANCPEPPLPEVVEAISNPTETGALEARIRALPRETQERALRGLLREIASWYLPIVRRRVRIGRRSYPEIEYVLGNPRSTMRTDPARARWVVDAVLSLVAETGDVVRAMPPPYSGAGAWPWILQDLDTMLQGPNLVPLAEHQRLERERLRQKAAQLAQWRADERALFEAFAAGAFDAVSDTEDAHHS